MTVTTKLIDYSDEEGNNFEGVLYIPKFVFYFLFSFFIYFCRNVKQSKVPAVLIFPAFRGITHFEKDKGQQIAEVTLKSIFSRFYKIRKTITAAFSGIC